MYFSMLDGGAKSFWCCLVYNFVLMLIGDVMLLFGHEGNMSFSVYGIELIKMFIVVCFTWFLFLSVPYMSNTTYPYLLTFGASY